MSSRVGIHAWGDASSIRSASLPEVTPKLLSLGCAAEDFVRWVSTWTSPVSATVPQILTFRLTVIDSSLASDASLVLETLCRHQVGSLCRLSLGSLLLRSALRLKRLVTGQVADELLDLSGSRTRCPTPLAVAQMFHGGNIIVADRVCVRVARDDTLGTLVSIQSRVLFSGVRTARLY